MKDMKTVYHVQGSLSRDFIGQISYTVCLKQIYNELDIEFSFTPPHYRQEDITPGLQKKITDYCRENYDMPPLSKEELENTMLHVMKTELHTTAFLNDRFIGGVHKQLTVRHMHFTAEEASEGCLPQPRIEGVLKVTVIAFSVLADNTAYSLTVRVR